MVTVVKSEWHQVERRYGVDLDESLLSEIYPDDSDEEIQAKLEQLASGELDIDTVMGDAWENGVEIEWDWLDEDDWWTDRKGGYDVTYQVQE